MTIAADLLQRHFQTLVEDNAQWQTLIADDLVWGQTDWQNLFCFVRDNFTGCDLRRVREHRD
jgi:hypothetical protein